MATTYLTLYRRVLPIADADRWCWLGAVQQAVEQSPGVRVALARYNECGAEAQPAYHHTYRVFGIGKTAVGVRARVRLIHRRGGWRLVFALQTPLDLVFGALVAIVVVVGVPGVAVWKLLVEPAAVGVADVLTLLAVFAVAAFLAYVFFRVGSQCLRDARRLCRVILKVMNKPLTP